MAFGACYQGLPPSSTGLQYSVFNHRRYIKIILTGSTGNLGSHLIDKIIQEKKDFVIGLARKEHPYDSQFENCKRIVVPSKSFLDSNELSDIIRDNTEDRERVLFVNAIGGAHPKKKETLETLNEKPALAFAEAVKKVSLERSLRPIFIQLSSITASLQQEDKYALIKRKIDEELTLNFKSINPICLRVGFAVQQLVFKQNFQMNLEDHAYTPSELAQLPMQPIVGDGKQEIQPVAMEDIINAIINIADKFDYFLGRKLNIINAVGPNVMTHEEFFTFFSNLYGKRLIPYYIPPDDFKIIANAFPKGHFAPYAAEYLKNQYNKLNHEQFECMVGRKLKTLEEFYKVDEDTELVFPHLLKPIWKHIQQILATLWQNKTTRGIPLQKLTLHIVCYASNVWQFKKTNTFLNSKLFLVSDF